MNSFVTIRLLQLRYDETRFILRLFFLSITIFQEDEQKLRTIN